MADQARFDFFFSFYHESMRTCIKTTVNKFSISNHTALTLRVNALKSYLKLICEYELHSLPNKKVSGAKDHGKNYMKVRPPHIFIRLSPFLIPPRAEMVEHIKVLGKPPLRNFHWFQQYNCFTIGLPILLN